MAFRDCGVCGGRGYVNEVCTVCNGSPSRYVDGEGRLNDCLACGSEGYVEEVCSSCGGVGEIEDDGNEED